MPTWTMKVAGVTFEGREVVVRKLKIGEELTLVREPTNKYDPNAVQIVSRIGQIGYIPRADAAWIAPLMDNGTSFSAVIGEMLDLYSRYPKVLVEVTQN